MRFIINRECLLKPLQQTSALLSGRPILPILTNLLIQVKEGLLIITGANLEVEIISKVTLNNMHELGICTVPARKFLDICRNFPKGAEITVIMKNLQVMICSQRSFFLLSTLPVSNFPIIDAWPSKVQFSIKSTTLKRLIEATQFSMAHEDIRYYLNGMLFETQDIEFRVISSDGHRLSMGSTIINTELPYHSVIVPRKSIIELLRMFDNTDQWIKLQIGSNNIRVNLGDCIFTSKLVNSVFPDYHRILPKNPDNILEIGCNLFKQALSRAAVLSNEQLHGVRLHLSTNQIKITSRNSEQEEFEEIIDVLYHGSDMEICFNVNYLIDVLNALKCNNIRLLLTDDFSSIQIENFINKSLIYIVMPMRL